MTARVSELNELSTDLAQSDVLPIVDVSASETKKIQTSSLIILGISGAPSSFIDLGKLNQSSATKLGASALDNTGVASGVYGSASGVASFVVNNQGLITAASGVAIAIAASSVTGLAPVATSGTYDSLSGLPSLGTISSQSAGAVVISGGTISGVTFLSGNVTISGGTISGITDLAIEDGGTGASTASGARTNLELVIGTDVQAHDSVLDQAVLAFDTADVFIYSSASGIIASGPVGATGLAVLSGASASGVRSTLGLGTLAIQDANSVAISGGTISGITLVTGNATISGGTISGITDIAIEDGGTGASTAADARTGLGLAIGSDVQAYSAVLSGVAGLYTAADEIVYSSASGVLAATTLSSFGRTLASGADAASVRTSLALGTMATQDASSVAISGGTISGITDLAIADGGTGASSAADARTNLGLVIGTNVQAYDAGLDSIAGLTTSADEILYLTGADTYASSPLPAYAREFLASGNSDVDARTSLGLGALAVKAFVDTGDIGLAVVSGANIISGSIVSDNYGPASILSGSIADGAIVSPLIADDAILATKLADNSSAIVEVGTPTGSGAFTGQQYVDTNTNVHYAWDGADWERQAALNELSFVDSTPIAFSVAYPNDYSATITTTLEDQLANVIFAGPSTGAATAPTFRALGSADLPLATSGTTGAVSPGAGLSVDALGALNHNNTVTPGTYTGAITVDAEGHISSAQSVLFATDIPDLDASKITTGTFASAFLADNSVTASQLADYGIAQVSSTAPEPEFAGQWWINPNDRSAYIWVGEVSPKQGYWLNLGYGSPSQLNLRFGGTYNASGNTVDFINSIGSEAGLVVGSGLASPNTSNNGVYLIVTAAGSGITPAPVTDLAIGNWILSLGTGTNWTKVDLGIVGESVNDSDVLVNGGALSPAASGVASQEDFNEELWARVQVATTAAAGIVRASSTVAVASGTGIMSIVEIDEGTY